MKYLLIPMLLLLGACSQPPETLPYSVEASNKGVGMLNERTPFSASKVAAALPGFSVEPFTSFQEGKNHRILIVKRGKTTIMQVTPDASGDAIGTITVLDPQITHKRTRIGSLLSQEAADFCTKRGGNLYCPSPTCNHISYRYVNTSTQPQNVTQSIWKLDAIIWNRHAR